MPSKPTIESWLPDAIQAFNKVLPVPEVSYTIVTKSKEEAVINKLKASLDVPASLGYSDNWAGLTLPGYKGTAIVISQYGLHGKTDFKHYLWHEMGHAFAFANESATPFWDKPSVY